MIASAVAAPTSSPIGIGVASDSSNARGSGRDVDSFDLSVAEDQGHDSESGYIAEIVDRFVFNEAAVVAGQENGFFAYRCSRNCPDWPAGEATPGAQ